MITISINLTEEQILNLALEKWYTSTIDIFDNTDPLNPKIIDTVNNPKTALETLKEQYESLILEDVTRNFINISNKEIWKENTDIHLIKNDITVCINSDIT